MRNINLLFNEIPILRALSEQRKFCESIDVTNKELYCEYVTFEKFAAKNMRLVCSIAALEKVNRWFFEWFT